jgi:hypothetical protein
MSNTHIGARSRSGSGNAITDLLHGFEYHAIEGYIVLSYRAPGTSLTVSSRGTRMLRIRAPQLWR